MAEPEIITLQIPRSPRFVSASRKIVEVIGARLALSSEQIEDLKLAVGEACANAVKFCEPDSKTVVLQYRLWPEKIQIEVRNVGCGFEWELPAADICEPTLDDNGRGLYLIDRLVDKLEISCEDDHTVVLMEKNLDDSLQSTATV